MADKIYFRRSDLATQDACKIWPYLSCRSVEITYSLSAVILKQPNTSWPKCHRRDPSIFLFVLVKNSTKKFYFNILRVWNFIWETILLGEMNLNRIDGPRLNPLLPDSVFTSSIIWQALIVHHLIDAALIGIFFDDSLLLQNRNFDHNVKLNTEIWSNLPRNWSELFCCTVLLCFFFITKWYYSH